MTTRSVGPSPSPRFTYVSWAESCSRSDHTARELGGTSHMVYAAEYGSRGATILWKYAVQWRRTQRILRADRPDVVVVMTPPLVASLAALWYARRTGGHFVQDAHSAAFLHPRWRYFQWLQRWLCRQARTTIVHNEHIGDLVRAAGGHATLVPDVPIVYDTIEALPRTEAFTVAVVCSFNYDEPVREIIEAARALPGVQFLMTGNPRHLAPDLKASLPPNLTLTGFISVPRYGGLLTGADVVMSLTTRDHTMLRGAYEAIYQGTPVIVSDFALLRHEYQDGAVHTTSDVAAIVEAVDTARRNIETLRAGARRARAARLARWTETRTSLLRRTWPADGRAAATGDLAEREQ